MLVVSRRVDESINIGHQINVKLLSINGNQVRIGIEAPKDLPIARAAPFNCNSHHWIPIGDYRRCGRCGAVRMTKDARRADATVGSDG